MKSRFLIIIIALLSTIKLFAHEVKIFSPNRQIEVRIETSPNMVYSIYYKNKLILNRSKIEMQINDGFKIGTSQKYISVKSTSIQEHIKAVIPSKNNYYFSYYKGMVFTFHVSKLRNYQIEFRVFNDGVAYRFITNFENQLKVENETVELNFPTNAEVCYPVERRYISSYESSYKHVNIKNATNGSLSSLPLLIRTDSINVLFSETNLHDYPNLFMKIKNINDSCSLVSAFPHILRETRPDPKHIDYGEIMVREEREIAFTYGKKNFPWRYFIISDKDEDLIKSEMTNVLSGPPRDQEIKWVKPGRVVKAGEYSNYKYKKEYGNRINNDTYKYYIDFASRFGFEYIQLGKGWSKSLKDITHTNNNINIDTIVAYGNKNNVDILLWVFWKPLDKETDSVLNTYQKWGVKGIQVDYMNRGEEYMVNFYEKVAKKTFEKKMIVSFHNSYKPVGLSYLYPNVLTYGSLRSNSYNATPSPASIEYTLALPFIRMTAGPLDFEPGALINSHSNSIKASMKHPSSLGTRSRQMAMFVIYESPLQTLYDAPTEYEKEPIIPAFIKRIPSTWDQTVVLDAKISEKLLMARRKGDTWYLAAMTNSKKRSYRVKLSQFLPKGEYRALIIKDGPDAATNAQSFSFSKIKLSSTKSITIDMVSGGGWVAIFQPLKKTKKKKKGLNLNQR